MTFKPLLAAVAALLAEAAFAQRIPDLPDRDEKNPAVQSAIKARMDAGRSAVAEKDVAGAVRHFANALWWNPFAPAVLTTLVEASAATPDAQALWALRTAAATMDERGTLDPEGPLKKLLHEDPLIAKIATARAEAAAQLAGSLKDLRGKDGDQIVLSRWTYALAHELLNGAPALRKRHGAAFNQALATALPDYKPVLAALKEVMDRGLGEQKPEIAIRAAQCLLGLAAQSRFKDIEGPKPPALESVAIAARTGLARAREQIDAKRKGPLPTIGELESMSREDRERFTREHASFENPGVTMSPNGMYRIETPCGHETLLGVAKTVEMHHARLAKHFGQDPFAGQPGLVRIVPESSGLEAEGTPYWWAGGFQSGSITTLKFSSGTIRGFGHGLTHELTHRFDGALNGGIPAWLAEGRAVWTGSAFGNAEDVDFVANHASFGTVEDAFIKGYGDEKNFTKLVLGTLDDYRHNYTAGYALYLFLATWKEKDAPLFAERLVRFERACKEKGGNSLEWFTACFCDDRGGRPKDMKAMSEKFGEFIRGFYWQSRAAWTGRYTEKVPFPTDNPLVYDAPTWHADRERAEPWFGQDQARIAGDVLLEAGRKREATLAYAWSLVVDEWRDDVVERFAKLLEAENRTASAWAVRNESARRFGKAAVGRSLPAELQRASAKAAAYAETLAGAAKAQAARPATAAALVADHVRLAALLALKPVPVPALQPDVPETLALDEPGRSLGLYGWEEDKLTHYEERRAKDLWYEVPEGDLHVGRSKPREGTGTMDRTAHQRDAFVRTREWFPAGRMLVTARIQVTTSFVSASVVLGFTRRDRNVRFQFSGGDFLYSIGAKDDKTQFDSIHATLRGLRDRDEQLWGAVPRTNVKFESPTSTFAIRIYIDGPQAVAYVNDRLIGTYHTSDGQAIEGHIGFASGHGAYLVAAPTIERRDRSAALGSDPTWPRGLDPSVAGTQNAGAIKNLGARGIPVGPAGALVLWIPALKTTDGSEPLAIDTITFAMKAASGLDQALQAEDHPTEFAVYLPAGVSEATRNSIEAELKQNIVHLGSIATHRHAAPLSIWKEGDLGPEEPMPTVLFLDPNGVVRVADRFRTGERSMSPHLENWLSVFESIASTQK